MNDFDNKQICSYKDIDRFGFTCDVCGRKVNGCSIVNGMKFCAKCYQETFCKDNQQSEIQQLKQQLAEKDKEIENCKRNELYEENMKILAVKNQKQLAIQELERIKELLLIESKTYPIIYDKSDDLVGGAIDKEKVFEIIDNQITKLKGV